MTDPTQTTSSTGAPPISRYPVPAIADLPEDLRARIRPGISTDKTGCHLPALNQAATSASAGWPA